MAKRRAAKVRGASGAERSGRSRHLIMLRPRAGSLPTQAKDSLMGSMVYYGHTNRPAHMKVLGTFPARDGLGFAFVVSRTTAAEVQRLVVLNPEGDHVETEVTPLWWTEDEEEDPPLFGDFAIKWG